MARRDLIGALMVAAVVHAVAAGIRMPAPLEREASPVLNGRLAISFVSTYRETGEAVAETPPQQAAVQRPPETVRSLPEPVQPAPVPVKAPVVKPPPVPAEKVVPKPKESIHRRVEVSSQARHLRKDLSEVRLQPAAKHSLTAVSASKPPQEPEPSRISEPAKKPVVTMPSYGDNPPPKYPPRARRRGYRGVTILAAEILADGTVGELRVKTSSGHGILDEAALRAVKTWTFEPARENGIAVRGRVDIPVRFELAGERK